MARSTVTASPAPSLIRASKPSMSSTQAAASEALAALLARRRGLKPKTGRAKKSERIGREADSVKDTKKERAVERNVRVLKRSGKIGEGEREVRRRILQMREEAYGKGKGKGKGKTAKEEDYDSDN